MPDWHRRTILTTGAALSIGGLASTGSTTGEEGRNVDDLPNPELKSNPETDEDWASYRGGAGHARFVEDGHQFDGDALEAAWSVEHTGSVAVADDTVYTTTADGVVARDATDGSLVWENTDVDADDPAVAGEMVYLAGDEVVALDRDDGSVRWESDFDSEEWMGSHAVAYDGVYVVVDGALYALEADDGSIRWEKEAVTDGDERELEFTTGTAAANGVVYAGTQVGPLAVDPKTGNEVWHSGGWYVDNPRNEIYATTTAVVVGGYSNVEMGIYDASTGSEEGLLMSETPHEPAVGREIYVSGTNYDVHAGSLFDDEYGWKISGNLLYGQAVICGETVYVYLWTDSRNSNIEYDGELVALDKYDGTVEWSLGKDDVPVGHIRAISDETVYVDHDGDLVALRERTVGDGKGGTVDRPADTRVTRDQTGPSGVRIAVEEDLAGLELTISERTTGVDTAEIADAVGNTLTTKDVSGLGPGDTFRIEHDLSAGDEYIVLVHAEGSYDRGDYDEDPDWPYDGGEFRVVEGIWARDRSSTGHFYAYTKLTALLNGDGDDDGDGDVDGTVDRPADTRVTPDTTTPSGVRIAVDEDLAGLELTISEQTTGADTAEIADAVGNTLTTEDISGLGPGDSFRIEHDLEADEEYILLVYADNAYDRGAYDEDPDWPYDGGKFRVLEGIWARDRSSTANFYAYTTLTALQ